MSHNLDRAIARLLDRFPPKHPDRSRMRPEERKKEKALRTNQHPRVATNGWQGRTTGTVNWAKQERIPVGALDRGIWAEPPKRGEHISSGKGRGNKGKKNSG
jgi:hypothetical protein